LDQKSTSSWAERSVVEGRNPVRRNKTTIAPEASGQSKTEEPMKLTNHVGGKWVEGQGAGQALVDPATGEELARASTDGIEMGAALAYARDVGGPALRALTYGERAALIGKIADVLQANREAYGEIALRNSGNTPTDAAIDIDGGIGTLKFFARAGQALGAARTLRDGNLIRMAKDEGFQALHVGVPMRGVAVHINAFNFPSWGLWEKAAVALLAGVPVVAKPATSTAWLSHRMVEDVVKAGVLPAGAISLLCGGAGDLLEHLTGTDLVAFTGSADTAARIRTNANVAARSVRLNVEADSLNSCILGPDVAPGTAEFDLFVKEVAREMTQKAGQKCTAIRRIVAPRQTLGQVADAIAARLAGTKVGNPRNADVRMGPLVNKSQQRAAQEGLAALQREAHIVFDGGGKGFAPIDADPDKAAFVPPTLLRADAPESAEAVHTIEVFGPVATLMPYGNADEAFALARRGGGSLVASVFSADLDFIETASLALADSHGRVLALNADAAKSSTGHGIVMPMCNHGGPGRAGGGSELGGLGALWFYHQRAALQGPAERLKAIAERSATTG
jgi:3,4-dehydroadipyl-CoA semialdehyde dehydrogenase